MRRLAVLLACVFLVAAAVAVVSALVPPGGPAPAPPGPHVPDLPDPPAPGEPALELTKSNPANGETGVPANMQRISLHFSAPVDPTCLEEDGWGGTFDPDALRRTARRPLDVLLYHTVSVFTEVAADGPPEREFLGGRIGLSPDRRTLWLDIQFPARGLRPNAWYVIALHPRLRATDGRRLRPDTADTGARSLGPRLGGAPPPTWDLESHRTVAFRTGARDTQPPRLLAVEAPGALPAGPPGEGGGVQQVPVNGPIAVVFDEPVAPRPGQLRPDLGGVLGDEPAVRLLVGDVPVPVDLAHDGSRVPGDTVLVRPREPLDPNAVVLLEVSGAVTDRAGLPLSAAGRTVRVPLRTVRTGTQAGLAARITPDRTPDLLVVGADGLRLRRTAVLDGVPAWSTLEILRPGPDGGPWRGECLVTADFDRDGVLDVFVGGGALGDDDLLLGTGSPLAAPDDPPPFRAAGSGLPALPPGSTTDAGAADVDLDGDTDLVLARFGGPDLVLLNDGAGRFPDVRRLPGGVTPTTAVDVARLDPDALPDVVLGRAWQRNAILLGRGDGRFEPAFTPRETGPVTDIAILDLDADGARDVLTAGWGSGLRLWLHRGDPTHEGPSAHHVLTPPGADPRDRLRRIAVADMQGDGRWDVLAAAHGEQPLRAWRNTGAGLVTVELGVTAAGGAADVLTAEFTDDGTLWVTLLLPEGEVVGPVRRARVAADEPRLVLLDAPAPGPGGEPAVLDVDRDGIPELAVPVDDDGLWVFRGSRSDGRPRWRAEDGRRVADVPWGPRALAVLDADRDGRPDLAVGGGTPERPQPLVLLRGGADGLRPDPEALPADARGAVTALLAGDFDGDGRPDLLAGRAGRDSTAASDVLLTGVAREGVNSALFVRRALLPADHQVLPAWTTALAAGDVDGDGRTDVVLGGASAGPAGAVVRVMHARTGPTGLWYPAAAVAELQPGDIPIGDGVRALAVAELTGDGRTDVLMVGAGGPVLYTGGAAGSLTRAPDLLPTVGLPGERPVMDAAIAVVRRPGRARPDVVLVLNGMPVWLRAGAGGGLQASPAGTEGLLRLLMGESGRPARASSVVAADLDGDGADDLVVRTDDGRLLPVLVRR